jgi:hypothetical protein
MDLAGREWPWGAPENRIDRQLDRPVSAAPFLPALRRPARYRHLAHPARQVAKRRTGFRVRECSKEVHFGEAPLS